MAWRALSISVAVLALGACGASEQAPDAPAVQLYAMDCGRLSVTDAQMFSDEGAYDGQARELVDPCYLIRHPDGDLIWDAGLPDSMADSPDGVDNGPFHLNVSAGLVAQLAQLGLTPEDIDYLSVSHSHFDHLGNAALFTQANWIVDTDEHAHMFSDEARANELFPLYSALENFNTTLIEGDGDHDVFGDGSVVIVQAPGHTPGHTILKLQLANAGTVLLTGDMYHMAESRADRRVPHFNTDRGQTLASMDMIEALAAETGARVVRQHVPEDFAALPAFPEALN
jgi:glyoxylase-like metal-dependent hydrolase (beta-lactamase superfamily II)